MSGQSSPVAFARATMAMESAAVLSSSLDTIGASLSQWVPDSERKECSDCCEPFSPFIRKHHCRSCGEIFCTNCSRRFLLLPKYKLNGYTRPQRTCATCVQLHGPASLQSVGTVEHRLPVWDLPVVVSKKLPFSMNGELMEVGEYVFRTCSSSKVKSTFFLSQAVESDENLSEWEKRIARSKSSLEVVMEMNGKDYCCERYFTIVAPSTWSLHVTFSSPFTSANVTVSILKSCTCDISAHFNSSSQLSPRQSLSSPLLSSGDARMRSQSSVVSSHSMGVEMRDLRRRERSVSGERSFKSEIISETDSATMGGEPESHTYAECGEEVSHHPQWILQNSDRETETYGEDETSPDVEDELKEWGFHTVDREELVAEYGRDRLKKELSVRCIPMKAVKMEAFIKACASWPSYEGYTALTYPQDRAREELGRWSLYREQAFELGLVRPFLLLVSMHPEVRLSYAQLLEVPLWEMDEFGDAHFEAYAMLVQDGNSVMRRANCAFEEEGEWYQVLWRIASQSLSRGDACSETRKELSSLSLSYKESLGYCQEPENPYIRSLEEVFLKGLVQVFDGVKEAKGEDEWDETRLLMESDCLDALVEKLRAAGFVDEWLMKRLATASFLGRDDHIAAALEDWCEKKQFYQGARQVASLAVPGSILLVHLLIAATPLFTLSPLSIIPATSLAINVVRLALFSKTPFSVLLPVIGIVCQRELLAYHDLSIDSFYGRDDTLTPNGDDSNTEDDV